jgi:hypothetical protein
MERVSVRLLDDASFEEIVQAITADENARRTHKLPSDDTVLEFKRADIVTDAPEHDLRTVVIMWTVDRKHLMLYIWHEDKGYEVVMAVRVSDRAAVQTITQSHGRRRILKEAHQIIAANS